PWLGYAWGRSLFQRSFRQRDGVFGEAGKLDGLLLPDGATRMMDRGHVSSCGACHNVPYRDAGAGMTIPKNGGTGRNSPHLFGGGLIEMIGQHLRLQALALADDNRDGWISKDEAKGKRCVLYNQPEGLGGQSFALDFGSFEDRDRGSAKGPTGISLDDPDRDGFLEEITEGDLDVVEWYLLNHPAPARGRWSPEVRHGEQLFDRIGCTVCHVPDWHLPAAGVSLLP